MSTKTLAFTILALATAAVAAVAAQNPSGAPAPAASATEIRITHIGNEGFLVECAGRKILVDALYRVGVPGYQVHTPELQSRLESAQPPFDGVDLVLATHVHNDHFEPNAVGKFLLASREAQLVTTPQTVERLERDFRAYAAIAARVRAIYPPEGDKAEVPIDGIALTAMALHHGRTVPFQNLGFLVEVSGVKFLHLGDSQASQAEIGRYGLAAAGIDVAFVPFWMLLDPQGTRTVREAIAPAKVVPMHVPIEGAPPVLFGAGRDRAGTLRVLRDVPGVVVFEAPLETHTIPIGAD